MLPQTLLAATPRPPLMLTRAFFARDALVVAQQLLGKVLWHQDQGLWLAAWIIETEAYYKAEKGSHASLGFTPKRGALFMPAGTIYMYYARGGDSFNISCQGAGNAVLLKSGYIYSERSDYRRVLRRMQELNPLPHGQVRPPARLCSGQTLLCRSLGLKVKEWDQQQFSAERLFIGDHGYRPSKIIQTRRLGIPQGRDEHLMYRFIDEQYAAFCTKNILTQRKAQEKVDYLILRSAGEAAVQG